MGMCFVGMGWARQSNVWGWGGDGSQVYGDRIGMEQISWGWVGNGADFHYRVTLYCVQQTTRSLLQVTNITYAETAGTLEAEYLHGYCSELSRKHYADTAGTLAGEQLHGQNKELHRKTFSNSLMVYAMTNAVDEYHCHSHSDRWRDRQPDTQTDRQTEWKSHWREVRRVTDKYPVLSAFANAVQSVQ